MEISAREKKAKTLTLIGVVIMFLLTLTKIIPSSNIAGYSEIVGIAFFFIVEIGTKTPGAESGLRFKSFFADIKKPGVLLWTLLPAASAIVTLVVGTLIFSGEFVNHVVGRTSSMLTFDKIPLLAVQIVIAGLGEEIAYRGFLVGKTTKFYPFWLCALGSSVLFASGHIAVGNFGLVVFDIATIFVDGVIYAIIYKKSGNCLVSTVAHILCNATGIAAMFIFL